MQPTDLALLRLPGAPTLTPDGGLAVYAVTRLDLEANAYRSRLFAVPTDGSASPRPLTQGPRDSAPTSSPDGTWLAFLRAPAEGKPQLHVLPAAGGEPVALTDAPLGVEGKPVWRPDSGALAYVARVPEPGRYGTDDDVPADKEMPRRLTAYQYRLDGVGWTNDQRKHLFVVDLPPAEETAKPQPRQLTDGDWDDDEPAWTADGSSLLFVSARHDDRDTHLAQDVFRISAEGGEATRLTRTTTTVGQVAVSVDGDTLFYVGTDRLDLAGRTTGLWSVPLDGASPPVRLTDPEGYDLDDMGVACRVTPVDDGVLCARSWHGALQLLRVPAAGGEPDTLLAGERQARSWAVAAGVLVVAVNHGTSAGELIAIKDGAETVLTDLGAELAPKLRPMTELATTAADGYPVHGWVVRPQGEGPHPVLLAVHGGPYTQYGHTLFDEAQVYAGAGYAVVLGNPRGSAGYGEAHGRSIVGAMGTVDADDLLTLLDTAIEADPSLDQARQGVLGGSYGGWMTTWLAGHTDRFRAALSERAVNAFDSFTGSSDIGWMFTDIYVGNTSAAIRQQSPLTYADKISCPMLIVHSEQDWRCPLEQAQRLYVHLKKRGIEVEMLVFPGEGHELTRSGLPRHRVARFEAVLDWFGRHLADANANANAP